MKYTSITIFCCSKNTLISLQYYVNKIRRKVPFRASLKVILQTPVACKVKLLRFYCSFILFGFIFIHNVAYYCFEPSLLLGGATFSNNLQQLETAPCQLYHALGCFSPDCIESVYILLDFCFVLSFK